jgi:hypothetical protein
MSVRRLVREHLHSAEQLAVLLLLFESAGREWTAAEVSRVLAMDASSTIQRLSDLRWRGFLDVAVGPEFRYRYHARSTAIDQAVRRLAKRFRADPDCLLNLLATASSPPTILRHR